MPSQGSVEIRLEKEEHAGRVDVNADTAQIQCTQEGDVGHEGVACTSSPSG